VLSAGDARALGLVNQVAPRELPFVEFVDRFIDPMRDREPEVMRALKAQALAERFGRPVLERRAGDQERFVSTWVAEAHWRAADALFKPERDA